MTDHKTTVGAPPSEILIQKKKKAWWPWLVLALVLLAALFALTRHNPEHDVVPAATASPDPSAPATPAVGVERVTLPGGAAIDLRPQTLDYELQRYLGSNEATPRTFTFDQLNFDTASADIRPADRATLTALSQILAAYPKVKVKLVGYADARGSDPANVKLGQARADAVAQALSGMGVQAARLATASGGNTKPVASNATSGGQSANRRTELVVTSK